MSVSGIFAVCSFIATVVYCYFFLVIDLSTKHACFTQKEKLKDQSVPEFEEIVFPSASEQVFKNVKTVRHEEVITLEKVCIFSLLESLEINCFSCTQFLSHLFFIIKRMQATLPC